MKIYGLVGPSGTGKSHHADYVAGKFGTDLIIDDGLLIKSHRVLAGFSAKFETTKLAAIKRAIFNDLAHRQQVKNELLKQITDQEEAKILILGTSKKMIQTICDNLEINGEIQWISIQDIVSENSMSVANNLRQRGMHAIPILQTQFTEPTIPHFIRKLSSKFLATKPDIALVQKDNLTIVNPLFGTGAIYIHPRVLKDTITELLNAGEYPFHLRRVHFDPNNKRIHIDVYLHAKWIPDLRNYLNKAYEEIYSYLQDNLSFVCPVLNLHVVSIDK